MKDFTRREFLSTAGIGLAGAMAAPMFLQNCIRPKNQLSGSKPNIIFIMADDLGYGELGCYGQEAIQTPNIDRMAGEGLKFSECYTGGAKCAPSRSVLLTGLHTGHTRIRGNHPEVGGTPQQFGDDPIMRASLKDEDITIAEMLKQAGYATGVTGKWGVAEPGTDGIPNRQGFDEWLGYLNNDHAPHYYTDYLWKNGKKVTLEGNLDGKQEQYTHDLFTEFALDFIQEHKDAPFFLYVPYTIPHLKMQVPELGEYADKDWPENAKIYAAMVSRMDRDVGRILDELDELNLSENTLVFFCSDNGPKGFDFQLGPDAIFNSAGPFRGSKGTFYEGGIRTPMVVRWKGTIAPGQESDATWYYADVMPTLADLAGADLLGPTDGMSVVPALAGGTLDTDDSRFLYWESMDNGEIEQAIRWNDYKALRHGLNKPVELYDLASDISESHNIAKDEPEITEKLGKLMQAQHTPSAHWPLPGEPSADQG